MHTGQNLPIWIQNWNYIDIKGIHKVADFRTDILNKLMHDIFDCRWAYPLPSMNSSVDPDGRLYSSIGSRSSNLDDPDFSSFNAASNVDDSGAIGICGT